MWSTVAAPIFEIAWAFWVELRDWAVYLTALFAVDKRRLSKDNRIFYVNTSYFEDLNPDDIHYSQVVFDHTYENIESYSRLFYICKWSS